jgi:putative ABC transport system substrate-binding protein
MFNVLKYLKRPNLIKTLGLFCLSFLLVIFGAYAVLSSNNNNLLGQNLTDIDTVNQANAINFVNRIKQIKATDFVSSSEQEEIPRLDWLELSRNVYENWTVSKLPDNPSTLIITPKGEKPSLNQKVILALIPIESSVYGVAVSTNLNLFRQNNIPAIFVVVNYGEIEDYGLSLLEEAKKNKIDLVLSVGSRATSFIYKHFRNETIPVVTNASKDPVLSDQIESYLGGSGNNIAFTSINPLPETLITYLLELKASQTLKNIAILYAKSNKSAIETQVEPIARITKQEGINSILLGINDPDPTTIKAELAKLIPSAIEKMRETDSDLNSSIFFLTGSVSVYEEISTINNYAQNVPVIAALPDVVKEGSDSAVLSIGAQMENVSYKASLYAMEILSPKTTEERLLVAGKLDVGIISPPDIAINFCRTKKIGLKLPFDFFEGASFIYDYYGRKVRAFGEKVEVNKLESWQNCSFSH